MEQPTPSPRRRLRGLRIAGKIILFLLLFIVVLFLALLTPPVQRFATARIEVYLEKKLQTEVEIGAVSIRLPKKVSLQNIYLEDKTKDTLLYGGAINADITLAKLLNGEVEINDLQLQNITAKVKRVLPDTVFNFQFVVDAFVTNKTANPDTAATAPLKMALDNLGLENFRLIYQDVVTGNDMTVDVRNLDTQIDTLNLEGPHINIPALDVSGLTARIKQSKPVVNPDVASADAAEAAAPITMKLGLGEVNLDSINVFYDNDVSRLYTTFAIGHAGIKGRTLDLQNRVVHLSEVELKNALSAIRLGNAPAAEVVAKEVKDEVTAQQEQGWIIRADAVNIDNNQLRFDNDNLPKQPYGIDYAHMSADSLTLHAENLVFSPDSVASTITQGQFCERSGFVLNELEGSFLYGPTQSYVKDLLVRTPGTELKRSLVLDYNSIDDLTKNFAQLVMDVDIRNSRIQVKDILAFAPQLRTQPAFRRTNDVWQVNLQGSGTLERLFIQNLQFAGFSDTRLDASGTLSAVTNPNAAGGNFTIRRFHTSQSDIALFTGARLDNAQMDLPETFDISGTVQGNMGALQTNLRLASSAGNLALNGRFANLTNPAKARYNATVQTSGLRLGGILRNAVPVGNLSANISVNGSGFTPQTLQTAFNGTVYSVGYNGYNYRNIKLNGNYGGNRFNATADVRDPNIDLTATVTGNLANVSSFMAKANIDSIKTLPLGFTTQQLIFRGNIDADIDAFSPDYLDGRVNITKALMVSNGQRLTLDSINLVSGRNEKGQFMRLSSDIVTASLEGQYKLADLGNIILHNTQPYFSLTPAQRLAPVAPYDFTFQAHVEPSPLLAAVVPGLVVPQPIHVEGRIATGSGINATVTAPDMQFGTNVIQSLNVQVQTTPQGLQLTGNVGHVQNGTAFNIYNTQLRATALNNVIDFGLGVDDKDGRGKYRLSGVLRQPQSGSYALQLNPDSLLLNYQPWTVAAGNSLFFSPTAIGAQNFVLQRDGQSLSLQSGGANGTGPLAINFNNFRLATITGFVKQDSLFVDGVINGGLQFPNLLQAPLFTSNLRIDNLTFQQDTVGNIAINANALAAGRYDLDATITGRGNDIRLGGTVSQAGKEIGLDLNLNVAKLDLASLEGLMAGAVKEASGGISGNVSIKGTSTAPRIDGSLAFNNAVITPTLLGEPFRIDGEQLQVNNDGLLFNNFAVRDSAGNALNFNGSVATANFINYNFDLSVDARNFRVMNTTKKDNKLYYGDLVLSTNIHLGGTESSPVVDGTLVVEDKTNLTIVIPQAEPGVAEREGVIQFVDMDVPEADSLFLTAYDSLNQSSLLGFNIAANLEVKKEAVLNMVIDPANGDLLALQGEALLTAGIDPSGKISLTGSYVLEQGSYQLSFNFIRRRFEIEKGSEITWLGEPTRARLNVTGLYIANAPAVNLVQDQLAASTGDLRNSPFQQKLPFEVRLRVTGEMLKPEIAFDVELPAEKNYRLNSGDVEAIQTRLTQLRQDQSELNKQVFALLLLNRFVSENPFQSNSAGFSAGAFARQSVSQLLSEQLNNLAGGLIGGVDINVGVVSSEDFSTGARENRTDLNVGLSKRLLNDRLTITVGSNFELEGPQSSAQRNNNLAGDVAVNYNLSKDGRYLLRFYRRNEFQGVVDGYIIETGLGFSINVDYEKFRELIGRKRKAEALDDKQKSLE